MIRSFRESISYKPNYVLSKSRSVLVGCCQKPSQTLVWIQLGLGVAEIKVKASCNEHGRGSTQGTLESLREEGRINQELGRRSIHTAMGACYLPLMKRPVGAKKDE